jgi:outer membrane protein assembly factor BamC
MTQVTRPLTMRHINRAIICAIAATALTGCSVLDGDKIDYKTSKRGNSLEVPPDLTQIANDGAFQSSGTVQASTFNARTGKTDAPAAANAVGDVRIERAGNQRWLVVKRPPEKLWDSLEEFWQDSGFLLNVSRRDIGIMETDWAENRAKLPLDFIRESLGKLLDTLYSTGELDKFRTRMERNGAGETEIYISHRGMIEVYTGGANQETRWQPRPADPELENEFLRRVMLRLGATDAEAAQAVVKSAATPKASVSTQGERVSLQLTDTAERAWRRLGLALDRTGFTVEDRDKTKGVYFVRYVDEGDDKAEPGFFSKLFGQKKADAIALQYQVVLTTTGAQNEVRVLDAAGKPVDANLAKRMLSLLAADLK